MRGKVVGHIIYEVIAFDDLRESVRFCESFRVASHHTDELSLGSRGLHRIVLGVAGFLFIFTLIVDSHEFSGRNHPLDIPFRCNPMLEEDAWCARHSHHERVGGKCVGFERILFASVSAFSVVVFYERDGISFEILVEHERFSRSLFRAGCEFCPILGIDSIPDAVSELEVKCRGSWFPIHFRSVNPVFDGGGSIPALTHGELRFCRVVVICRERTAVTFNHIISESCISEVVEQKIEISLHACINVFGLMVDVASPTPSFARVIIGRELVAIGCSPLEARSSVVVLADVCRYHLIGLTLIGFFRKIDPVRDVSPMVDNHIGNGTQSFFLEGGNHTPQLILRTE